MAMAVNFVVGKAFEALYEGVEEVIRNNLIFSDLCKDIKDRLDCLAPVIDEMGKYNQQLHLTKELEALEGLIKRGTELVGKCSKLGKWSIRNIYKKQKYSNEFLEFEESLQKELEVLKVQVARDVKKTEVAVENMAREVKKIGVAAENIQDEGSMLILTAPAGCGKTTLATKFCQDQDIKDKFQENIFFVTFTKKPNLERIMKGLYEQKGYKGPASHNEATPVKWLERVRMEKASLGDKSSHIPEHLSKEIVKYCNGFPLTITVAGRSLCGQPEEMWRSRVDEWSESSKALIFQKNLSEEIVKH
ncbi:hypothetical protein ACLB2K_067954 [Fragaria x ananassa]